MHGLLNITKHQGMTSRDVVNRVQRLARPAKAGHAGTLDPMATGVLVVCVGKATRLIQFVQQQSKRYSATFRLNQCSDTDDSTGRIIETVPKMTIKRDQIEALLPEFQGRIQQVPPAFSAVHVKGKRAYDLARKGEHVELKPREVQINRLELTRFEDEEFDFDIECGSGTYIRSIGRDIGRRLGCGAVMSKLERTGIGVFDVETAIDVESLTKDNLGDHLQPLTLAVPNMPRVIVNESEIAELRNGRFIQVEATADFDALKADDFIATVDSNGELIALCHYDKAANHLRPKHVF